MKMNWVLAVVVYKRSLEIPWTKIQTGFERKLNRRVEAAELHVDRLVLWCANLDLKQMVLRNSMCNLFNVGPVKVVDWNQDEHWFDVKIGGISC